MSFDITFVSYSELPNGDPDDLLTLKVLADRGYKTQAAVWNDPQVDWSNAGLCVLRSTWDYHLNYTQFIRWLYAIPDKTQLLNPLELVTWNADKVTYMVELLREEMPVVQTHFVLRDSQIDLVSILDECNWQQAVIKPSVGCGTFSVLKVNPKNLANAERHFASLVAHGDVLVQPYIPSVETYGERALVFFNGEFSHAVSKAPFQALLPTGHAGEKPVVATDLEVATAEQIISAITPTPLYARVDLVQDDQGDPKLLELELVEPSLFLGMDRSGLAPELFADAIENRMSN